MEPETSPDPVPAPERLAITVTHGERRCAAALYYELTDPREPEVVRGYIQPAGTLVVWLDPARRDLVLRLELRMEETHAEAELPPLLPVVIRSSAEQPLDVHLAGSGVYASAVVVLPPGEERVYMIGEEDLALQLGLDLVKPLEVIQ